MAAPPPEETDQFLEVMRETRARFAAGFADQLDRMRRQTAGAGGQPELDALKRTAHQIAGLSGTLGFAGAGAEAADLEAEVDAALAGGAFDASRALAQIARIAEAFDAERGKPAPWEH
jgi:HPt (histidine-containing phosphotransfer) domain-containing protein